MRQRHRAGTAYLSCGEDAHVALALPQEGQVTGGKVVLLLGLARGQVKDAVPDPAACFQHRMHSWGDTRFQSSMEFQHFFLDALDVEKINNYMLTETEEWFVGKTYLWSQHSQRGFPPSLGCRVS